jgi:uncharacterized protein with PIN domain
MPEEEPWTCGDCSHTEPAPVNELAGRIIRKTVGSRARTNVIETSVCPNCYSEDWHSESVRNAFLGGD